MEGVTTVTNSITITADNVTVKGAGADQGVAFSGTADGVVLSGAGCNVQDIKLVRYRTGISV